jgi:hypothetical protein
MTDNQPIEDLKNVLDKHSDRYEIDINQVHEILKGCTPKDYLEIARTAFDQYLNTKDTKYKTIFGIAITYARDIDKDLSLQEWREVSNCMQQSVSKYNDKRQESLDWNRLPSELSSMKTMVFTIINRDMMKQVISSLKKNNKALPLHRTRSFTRATETLR